MPIYPFYLFDALPRALDPPQELVLGRAPEVAHTLPKKQRESVDLATDEVISEYVRWIVTTRIRREMGSKGRWRGRGTEKKKMISYHII